MLYCRSCCRRRRRYLSSLISMEPLIVFPTPDTVQGLFSFKIRHIYARTCALAVLRARTFAMQKIQSSKCRHMHELRTGNKT